MLVSVIVPVYNVESFISKTVNSLLEQTYKTIEIILIDDGSTDNSGQLCDDYARYDKRIQVIHKKNEGPSIARNIGKSICKGDYIAFVDGDDYVHPKYIEVLVHNIIAVQADISACNYRVVSPSKPEKKNNSLTHKKENAFVQSRNQAIEDLLYQRHYNTAAWAKLMSRKIALSYDFPENELFEDYFTVYKYFDAANSIVYCPTELYFYTKREGSITKKKYTPEMMNYFAHGEQLLDDIERQHPDLFTAALSRQMWACFFILFHLTDKKRYKNDYEKCSSFIHHFRYQVLSDGKAPKRCRLLCAMSYFGGLNLISVFNK